MKKDRDLDEIYSETWNRRTERLEKLGRATYEEFLSSDHWARTKEVASGRPNYKKCEFCRCSLIAIAFLTQYAPELNPVAAIWVRVKRV